MKKIIKKKLNYKFFTHSVIFYKSNSYFGNIIKIDSNELNKSNSYFGNIYNIYKYYKY